MNIVIKHILLFLLLWLLLLGVWRPLSSVASFGFDAQNLMLWEYSTRQGMLPFRDVFYPYGLLPYFQPISTLLRIIYLALPAVYLTLIYFSLTSIMGRGWKTNLALLLLTLFILRTAGFDTFTRYGGALTVGLLAASHLRKKWGALLLGLLTGLLFSGLFDQGIYAGLLIAILLIIQLVDKTLSIKELPLLMAKFSSGLLLGMAPFFWFILKYSLLTEFVSFLSYLRDVSIFAKTPFTPFAASPDNLYTFAIIFMSVAWLAFNYVYKRQRIGKLDQALVVVITLLVFLEQKSFIRSMDRQLTFLASTAYLFFIFTLIARMRRLWRTLAFLVLVMLVVAFSTITHPVGGVIEAPSAGYELIVNRLKREPGFNGKLFSFPGDPVFYVYTGQNPPFYFTAYEATPKYAQERLISYIKDNNICFILLNRDIPAIQDGVPNEARSSYLLKFINSSYVDHLQIDTFTIMKSKLGCGE